MSQRTTEIGVRLALGATGRRVVAQIVGESLRVIGVGALVGWLIVFVVAIHAAPRADPDRAGLRRRARSCCSLVAAFACWLPARRAARVDPMAALRHE